LDTELDELLLFSLEGLLDKVENGYINEHV
jgi:hypothetical protein